jgi:hypothetical protein
MTQKEVLGQIEALLSRCRGLVSRSQYDDCSGLPKEEITSINTLMSECIYRFAPSGSRYRESVLEILKDYGVDSGPSIRRVAGVLDALRISYESGYLATVSELIHAEMFTDFIEMADHLLSEGYKDPAAVMIGSVLEAHLRQLAQKNGVDLNIGIQPKKADRLNADLAAQGAFSKLDQKSVTSWLDLRNKAAHGKYNEYSRDQVALHLQGIRDFIARNPA